MNQIEEIVEEEVESSWVWWLLLPILILGYLVALIFKASMQSVFDEEE